MPKIIAVCPKEFVGVSAVFQHGERLGYWKHIKLGQKIPECDILLLGAWHPLYWNLLEEFNCGVYVTSTIGQMGFSYNQVELNQLAAFKEMLETKKIKFLLFGWEDLKIIFSKFKNTFHCPYPFNYEYLQSIPVNEKKDRSIGMFLPAAPRKNIMNQYLAAKAIEPKGLYTNMDFEDKEIHQTAWLPEDEYFKLISSLKVTLHATFTESFSYAAAESIMLGTIPIISLQVAMNFGIGASEGLPVCFQCDSISQIAVLIEMVLKYSKDKYENQLVIMKNYLIEKIKSNQKATDLVLDKIGKL